MNLPNKCLRLLTVTLRGGRMTKLGGRVVSCGPCLAVAIMAGVISGSQALAFDWDGNGPENDGVIQGGDGHWDDTTTNWTTDGGTTNVPWSHFGAASFGGTAGRVEVDTTQFVNSLTFDTDGYELNGSTLVMDGFSPSIAVNTGTATINSDIDAWNGLTKSGEGELVLSGFGFFFGQAVNVTEGQLTLGSPGALFDVGSLSVQNAAGSAVVDLGGYSVSLYNLEVDGLSGTEVKNGTADVFNLVTIGAGQISATLTGAGGLLKENSTTATLTQQNTLTGAVDIQDGTLVLTEAGGLNNASSVTIGSAGTLSVSGNNSIGDATVINNSGTFELASGDETVGSITGTGDIDLGANSLTLGYFSSYQTIDGVVKGTGNLINNSGSLLNLTGVNSATGTLQNDYGTLQISGTWAGDVDNASYFELHNGGPGDATYDYITTVQGTVTNRGAMLNYGAGTALLTGLDHFVSAGLIDNFGDIVIETENFTYQDGHYVFGTLTLNVSDTIIEERTSGPTWSGTDFTENFATNADGVFTTSGDFTTTGTFTHNSTADLTVNGFNLMTVGALTNNGDIKIATYGDLSSGSTINNNADATIDIGSGASLNAGSGAINNAGEITMDGTSSLIYAGTLTNTGTIDAMGGIFGAVVNEGSGVFEATNSLFGITSFTNTGSATFDVTSGSASVIAFANTTNSSGDTTIANGATLNVAEAAQNGLADGSVDSKFYNEGTLSVHGTLTNHAGAALYSADTGSVIYAGEIINNGLMLVDGVIGESAGTGTTITNSGAGANFAVYGDTSGDGSTVGDFLNENDATLEVVEGTLELATLTNASTGGGDLFSDEGVKIFSTGAITATTVNNSGYFTNEGTLTATTINNTDINGILFNTGTIVGDINNAGGLASGGSFMPGGVIHGDLNNSGFALMGGELYGDVINTGEFAIHDALSGVTSFTNNDTGVLQVSGAPFATTTLTNTSSGSGTTPSTAGIQIAADASIEAENFSNSGTINNAGLLKAPTLTNADGGHIVNTGTMSSFNNQAGAELQNTGVINGSGDNSGVFATSGTMNGSLYNSGEAEVSGVLNGGISITGGTVNITGDLTGTTFLETLSGGGMVNVSGGTFEVSSIYSVSGGTGTSPTTAGVQITETGAVDANSIYNYDGATFNNAGTVNASNIVNLSGGTLTNSGVLNGEVSNSGTLVLSGTVDGALTNSGEVSAQGVITGDIQNTGTFNVVGDLTGSSLYDTSSGTTTRSVAKVLFVVADSTPILNVSGGTFDVAAVNNTSSGTGTGIGTAGVQIEESGTLTTASLTNSGTVNNAGTLIATEVSNSADATLISTGTLTGEITNEGTLEVGGEMTGAITNSGDATISGVLTGVTGVDTVYNTGTVTNTGTIDGVISNFADFTNDGTVISEFLNGGTVENTGTIEGVFGNTGTLTNTGTVTGEIYNDGEIDNSGTMIATFQGEGDVTNSGTLALEGTLTGALDNTGAGTVTTTGDVTGITDLTNSSTGAITISAGHTLEVDTITLADGSGGLDIEEGGALVGLGNTLNNGAALEVSAGGTLMDAGAINNLATGTLTFNGDTTLTADTDASGGEGITNAGAFNVSGGTLDASLGGAGVFENSGQISLTSGATLAVTGDFANTGSVDMQNASIGESLTVDGDFTGGGTLAVDVDFAANTSDSLIVTGDVSGDPTTVYVADISTGEATGGEFLVVQVAGETSEGDFVIDGGAIVAGAYTYDLALEAGAWSLANAVNSTGETYEAFANSLATFKVLGTHTQRVNARQWLSKGADGKGAWFTVSGDFASATPLSTSGTRFETETNTYNLRVGYDMLGFSDDYGDWVFGLTGLYGTATTETSSDLGTGTVDSTGYGFGASATWYGDNGVYLDVQGQMAWIDSDMASSTSGSLIEDYSTTATTLSVEAGARIALSAQSAIVPQAQLTYAHLDGGSFTDTAGSDVSFAATESVTARIGASYEFALANSAAKTQADKVYVIGNLLHTTSDASLIDVGGDVLSQDAGGSWLEVGAGGSIPWDAGKTVFFETSYKKAIDARATGRESFGVTAGLQLEW